MLASILDVFIYLTPCVPFRENPSVLFRVNLSGWTPLLWRSFAPKELHPCHPEHSEGSYLAEHTNTHFCKQALSSIRLMFSNLCRHCEPFVRRVKQSHNRIWDCFGTLSLAMTSEEPGSRQWLFGLWDAYINEWSIWWSSLLSPGLWYIKCG